MHRRASKNGQSEDVNQLATRIVSEHTGQSVPKIEREKNPAAVALGKLGGSKGGIARAKNLSAERKKEIARHAAQARWLTKGT